MDIFIHRREWKRILVIVGICLQLPFFNNHSLVMAQVGEHREDFAVGFNGGYVMSSLAFVPEVPQLQHTGFTGGLTFRFTSEKYFKSICAIVAEVNYANIGWKEDILTPQDEPVINAVTGEPEQYERDLTYIQIPVFARMGWGRERKGVQVFAQAGPQMGILLGEHTKMNFPWEKRTPTYSDGTGRTSGVVAQDTMAVENKLDYGIAAGLGIEFSFRKVGHFMLEGRFYYGLGNIYGNSKRDFFARSNFNNITVKLTYLFDVRRTKNSKIK
ncbi:MAG: PorT family protein [Prevotella sp.]|nr:PorT family protein [Prevotella sp.]